jgi:DNA-binding CsgD family transcriptional regulator
MDRWARSIVAEAREVVRLEELAEGVLPALERATGADGAMLYRYQEPRVMTLLLGPLVSVVQRYSPAMAATDPMMTAPDRLPGMPRIVLARRLSAPREIERSVAWNEFYRPHRLGEPMCIWLTHFAHGAPGMTNILLARSRFDDRAIDRVRAALPDLAAAFRRARRLEQLADLAQQARRERDAPPPAGDLTRAEWRVLRSMSEGLSNPAIARRLDVSVETVRTHVKRILSKLAVHSRIEAVLWLMRREGAG